MYQAPLVTFVFAAALLAICVTIHAAGLIGLVKWLIAMLPKLQPDFWSETGLLIRVAYGITVLHLLQILLWAYFFIWQNCLADLHTAFYFSSVTYATVGFGDVVLPVECRNMSSIEALTGILMVGLSTGFFFMLLNKIFQRHFTRT